MRSCAGTLRRDYSPTEVTSLLEKWKEAGRFDPGAGGGTPRDLSGPFGGPARVGVACERERCQRNGRRATSTTLEEVTLLSPLDVVSARGRAKIAVRL